MLIPELYSSQLALQPPAGGAAIRAWTAGQILEATVVRQALDGTVTLRIGNQEIQARTGLALSADQPLTLQVAQSGTQAVLRVLQVGNTALPPDAAAARTATAPATETALAQAWRQVLPRDGDLKPLLTQLAPHMPDTATGPGASTAAPLPAPLAQLLRLFAVRLPALDSLLTPAGLRQAVRDSGLFLEAQLAQAAQTGTPPATGNDLKAGLLQLVEQLRAMLSQTPTAPNDPAPALALPADDAAATALLRQADAALARVEHNQLIAAGGNPDTPAPLIVELPVRTGGNTALLRLRIEPDDGGKHGAASEAAWSVALDFDLEPLGPVQARIALAGDNVSTALWAERPETVALFETHLAELDAALRGAGLAPVALRCHAGSPPQAAAAPPDTPLLDERA